ncbi:MAG: Multiple sugar transport system permease protein, partial [Rubritepida sp.]|nr:Multiple sugar transport system permease protein [Rubritepida sp.]
MSVATASTPVSKSTGIYSKAGSLSAERRWAMWTAYASLILASVIFLAPPVYMFITSLKGSAEIANMRGNPWLVHNPTLENYTALLGNGMFLRFFLNSAIVTTLVVAITMVISILAAFALARMRFWGSQFLATGVFLTYLVPDTLLFIPLYQIVGGLGLLNSIWGLVLVYPTLTVPFCTWIMIGYFASIPKELDEAALIDGANWMQMLTKIFIPVAMPGIIAATIFAFTVSWAAFVYPT